MLVLKTEVSNEYSTSNQSVYIRLCIFYHYKCGVYFEICVKFDFVRFLPKTEFRICTEHKKKAWKHEDKICDRYGVTQINDKQISRTID